MAELVIIARGVVTDHDVLVAVVDNKVLGPLSRRTIVRVDSRRTILEMSEVLE